MRHVGDGQGAVLRHDDHTFDTIAEFADIARPVVSGECVQCLGCHTCDVRTVFRIEQVQVVFDQQRYVFAALAQGRHVDVQDVQPEIKVLAKITGIDHSLEVAVGGGNQADIDLDRFVAPDAFESAGLEHAQQLHLHSGVDFTDLVEEERAAVCGLESTDPSGIGIGEGVLLMTEQFAFEQVA